MSKKTKRKNTMLFTAMMFMLGTFLSSFVSASSAFAAETAATAPPAIVEEFESTDATVMTPSSARANSVKLVLPSRPDPVRYGYHAVGLSYDFIGQLGTSAAYINLKDSNGTAGRSISGLPKKLGVWVYGDGNNHWLRSQVQDATGTKLTIDFTSSSGLSWTGWKYVTATMPSGMATPIKVNQLYVVETKDNNKNAGTIYFDRLSAIYGDSTVYALDIVGLTPMQAGEAKQAKIYATYDGSTEPAQVSGGVSFASSAPDVASVDAAGTVTALQPGTTTITGTVAGAPQAAFELTVSAQPQLPQKLELAAASKLEVGQSNTIRTYATYGGVAEPLEILSGVSFESSDPAIATVDAAGTVKGMKAGTTAITASYAGVSAQYQLTVSNPVPVLQKIELTGLSALNVGDTKQAKVMGTYTLMNEPIEITSGVTFTSSSPDVASVSATGLVTAKNIGTARIMAAFGGKSSDFLVVVNVATALPKRELRAAWIATVDNVDWPAKGVTNAEQQKADYIALLDDLQEAGINAVITQIKPTADSFYPSNYGPWSEWLTGVQGQDPGYNPLAFMIEEVHKRNMEFHAWFNPYRVSMQDQVSRLVENHPARQHPDWVVSYGGKLYYNPGVPEAREFITNSVMEVVNGYDIDGVHFDDYFYPYPVSGVDFPDNAAYQSYGTGFTNKAEWRRYNVDTFIHDLSVQIKGAKPYVKFGISPFGIWKNKSSDPNGSDTNGLESYSALNADTRKWVLEEWIDYITPQVYWYFGYSPAAYEKVTDWWRAQVQGRKTQLYIGHAAYRIGAADPAWLNPDEMPNQIAYNRNFSEIKGSMFFSAKSLQANLLGFTDRLHLDIYRYPALVPTMPWLDSTAPGQPMLNKAVRKANGMELTWNTGDADTAYYVVYRFEGNAIGNLEDASHIVTTVRKQANTDTVQSFTDLTAVEGQTYTYAVTAVDRVHNESAASNGITVTNTLDSTPPTTTAVKTGTEGTNGWYTSDVTIELTATDEGTGVERMEISLDGGANWLTYSGPVAIADEGVHAIAFRSTDAAGNVEATQTMSVSIDKTPPVVTIVGAETYSVDQTVLITCTATDEVSGVTGSSCAAPLVNVPAHQLELGTHKVAATATDAAGHVTTATATYIVQVTADSLASLTSQYVTGPGAQGIVNSLLEKLEHGDIQAYIHEVSAQKGKKIPSEQADLLMKLAAALQ